MVSCGGSRPKAPVVGASRPSQPQFAGWQWLAIMRVFLASSIHDLTPFRSRRRSPPPRSRPRSPSFAAVLDTATPGRRSPSMHLAIDPMEFTIPTLVGGCEIPCSFPPATAGRRSHFDRLQDFRAESGHVLDCRSGAPHRPGGRRKTSRSALHAGEGGTPQRWRC